MFSIGQMQPAVTAGAVVVGALIVIGLAYYQWLAGEKKRREREYLADRQLLQTGARLESLLKQLSDEPDALEIHRDIRIVLEQGHPAANAYQQILSILEMNPAAGSLRSLALDAGRCAAAQQRPEGVPTTYDEQAIQNDIMTRTSD